MNGRSCCQGSVAHSRSDPRRPLERCRRTAQWLLPGAIMVAMPKCPACIAAYLTLATGVGISLPVAGHLRTGLLTLCAVALVFLVAKRIWSLVALKQN